MAVSAADLGVDPECALFWDLTLTASIYKIYKSLLVLGSSS